MKMTMHQIYQFYQYQQYAREADQLRPIYCILQFLIALVS